MSWAHHEKVKLFELLERIAQACEGMALDPVKLAKVITEADQIMQIHQAHNEPDKEEPS